MKWIKIWYYIIINNWIENNKYVIIKKLMLIWYNELKFDVYDV